jgi:DNA mismatch endonuclease (patch repair protein)
LIEVFLDTFSKPDRSEIMRRVHSKDTTPEVIVRSLLHRLGYRFRLYRSDLPGKPDIVLPKYKTAIFVHGCFWHRHKDCKRATTPATRQEYWLPKFKRTINRDRKYQHQLVKMGWKVIVIWECQTKNVGKLSKDLIKQIKPGRIYSQTLTLP